MSPVQVHFLHHEHHPAVQSTVRPHPDGLLRSAGRRREDLRWDFGPSRFHRLPSHARRQRAEDLARRSHPRYVIIRSSTAIVGTRHCRSGDVCRAGKGLSSDDSMTTSLRPSKVPSGARTSA